VLAVSKEWLFVSAVSSGGVVLDGVGQGWWLVASEDDGSRRVVDGPFPQRTDASWAAGAHADRGSGSVRPVYGVRRADGVLHHRPSPQEWAWLAHLGGQLDRLPEDWDTGLSDDDPLATLVVEVAAALAEAGLPLHDSSGPDREAGGACLTPETGLGIVLTWRQHDRMSVDQLHGAAADTAVQQVMNTALAEVLRARGFVVDAFGGASGHVVRLAD
jgi:hypothetical protein